MKTIIQLNNITKGYNDRQILTGINIQVKEGDFIAIVGKSGAGKSTLMNILGLVEYWDEGEYIYRGISLKNKYDHYKIRLEEIGFVFQNYNLISSLSCRENILLPTLYYGGQTKELEKLAEQLNISHLLDTSVKVLSGGEKQRVGIARALILNPKLIIADEPTGNLDEENKLIVLDLLEKANENGCSIILITHDHLVAKRAKVLLELKGGKLHEKN
ncbi:ABC transporter ATP-binding protein [Anaerobranca gottschalkii]|uniref:ABC-type lipoprotein export system, ATPase component n=1 Tax=Anaerobranca gottschalkii DSM 13577 TaxID=1120990 RepID=A0A1H9ZWV2_9FIRM|nr:ABC transporter ATP-binding protein [Anaerobranca gottschalkii]SES86254.1 ABC-type lipoprotein export system, ATPase component [Anaerobranca gottschalkii DSM 13577]